jgi:O-antigen/teichoic acid export membrane protein
MSSSVADLSTSTTASKQADIWSWSRARQFAFSLLDQGLSVSGMFLVNISLARTSSKTEYGVFALCYSVYTFLTGLHNAAILETYTVYGSGRYSTNFAEYEAILWRANALVGATLTAILLVVWTGVARARPNVAAKPLLGMALATAVLLTASFVRRTFYIRRRPDLAARFSTIYFVVCVLLLWVVLSANLLSGFAAFLIAAVAWCVAGTSVLGELPGKGSSRSFMDIESRYWREHWKYARWVLITALVFQFTTQAYYWLAATLLNVREVANLRAMYNLVGPVDQVVIALSLLVLPSLARQYSAGFMENFLSLRRRYAAAMLAITVSFALAIRFLGRGLLHVIYAGKFDDVAPLLFLLALSPLIMGLGNSMSDALKAAERPQFVFYAYVCSGIATFVGGIALVIHFGLAGAIYGVLLSGVVYSGVLALGFRFVVKTRTKRLIPSSAT